MLVKPITSSAMHDTLVRVLRKQLGARDILPLRSVESEAELRRSHGGQLVLLVEDNPINQEVAVELLQSTGLRVDTADDGELIGGISMDTLATIEVGLTKARVAPADYDAFAQRFGVTPGAWAATAAAWQAKIRSDWRIGAAYGELCEAKQKAR